MRIFHSLLVLPTEEWQQDNVNRQWWRQSGRLRSVSTSSGGKKYIDYSAH